MKKIFLALCLIFLFLLQALQVHACSMPPDILNRFFIFEENSQLKLKYSLHTRDDFVAKLEQDFQKQTGKKLNSQNIQTFIDDYISNSTVLSYNGKPLTFTFESVNFFDQKGPNFPYLEIIFTLDIQKLGEQNYFLLEYDKKNFLRITNFAHAYMYSEIEENEDFIGYKFFGEERYDIYKFGGKKYAVVNYLEKEDDTKIFHILDIKNLGTAEKTDPEIENSLPGENTFLHSGKDSAANNCQVLDETNFGNSKKIKKENSYAGKNTLLQGEKNNIWNKTINYFQNLIQNKTSFTAKILGIVFAIIFGALHGLLPGHAKSIIGAYALSENTHKKWKNQALLVLSITISHTIFLFFLAYIIHFLQIGVGTGTYYSHKLGSILYIFFGGYFIYLSLKFFLQKKHSHHHTDNCSCCHHHHDHSPNTFKKTLGIGILFGCVPCIDALALFLFALGIGKIGYATLIIGAFSLGLGLMLAVLSFIIAKGNDILISRKKKYIDKFIKIIIFILGIAIVGLGIKGLL